jgi:hypothetical protein
VHFLDFGVCDSGILTVSVLPVLVVILPVCLGEADAFPCLVHSLSMSVLIIIIRVYFRCVKNARQGNA